MAERLTPGVYIEEPPSAVRPIQAASTSTAGFLGEAERGIPGRATFVRSMTDFQRAFGGIRRGPDGHLAAAVQAFFDAGGTRAYVVRVLPNTAAVGESVQVAAAESDTWGVRRPVLQVRAKGAGAWSSSLRAHVEPSSATAGAAFRLRVDRVENGRSRTLETFDQLRMDPDHPDYVATVVNATSRYVDVDDLFARLFVDADDRTDPPLPDEVAALPVAAPPVVPETGAALPYRVPRRAVLECRWRDTLGQVGSPGSDTGRGVEVRFDRPSTPGTIAGDTVLLTQAQLASILHAELGADFGVNGRPVELISTDGPWDTSGGNDSDLVVDGGNVTLTFTVTTSASINLGPGPFNLNAGDVLDFTVNGTPTQHTLTAAEINAGAATPAELEAVVDAAFPGLQAAVNGGDLVLTTTARGPAATLAIVGATAAALGAPAAAAGAGNVADRAAVTAAELAAAVDALPGPLTARVDGARVVVSFADVAAHNLDWVSDPGPDDILAATNPVTSPVSDGPVRITPPVATRAYTVATFAAGTVDLSTAGILTVAATSGGPARAATVDPATFGNPAAVPLREVATALTAAFAAAEAAEADRMLVTAVAAANRLVLSAPGRAAGLTLRLTAAGAAPWAGAPAVRDGAAGRVVEDQRAVEITVSERPQAGVARALPVLFDAARATGRTENDPGGPAVLPAPTGDTPLRLAGGTDGTGHPGITEFTEALAAFNPVDLGLLAAPGRTDGGYVSALSRYAERWDLFYVADGPGSDDPDFELSADDVRQAVEGLPARSRNAGMFYPWVQVPDPVGVGRDPKRFLPPSGHVSGIIARTDQTRGVWKAPAGVEAGVSGAVGLQHQLVDGDQDLLNPIGLNCLREFPTAGIVTWGSRTLATESDPAWRYLPVRRTALFLKESLRRGLQWAVFEPNDEDLWQQITLNVTAFMLGLFRQGAFQGGTPELAFLVQCDRDTNPQELIDQGIVTTRVAFAPLKPAEFVVVELSQKSLVAV